MHIRDTEIEVDRDRGILTPSDRKFLLDEVDIKPESQRQVRQRIRERIKNSLRDYWFIRYGLSERDRKQIGDDLFQEGPLWQGYVDMISFYYILNRDRGAEMSSEIRNGVKSAEEQLSPDGDLIDVSIEYDIKRKVQHKSDEIYKRFEKGESITPEEGKQLIIESPHFDHLSKEDRWKKFAELINGELENECEIDEEESFI